MINRLLFLIILFASIQELSGQRVGYGLVSRLDFYSRYSNPDDNIASSSAGSALINLGLGPKIWVGSENFSVSAEGAFVFSPFALSTGDFKGLGALALPVLGRLNFGGLSNLNKEGKFGFSIGAGYQWTRTEFFGLQSSFEEQGVQRNYFRNLIGEIGYGYGMGGFSFGIYGRYGRDGDQRSNVFSLGMIVNLNSKLLKVTTDPEF